MSFKALEDQFGNVVHFNPEHVSTVMFDTDMELTCVYVGMDLIMTKTSVENVLQLIQED